MLPDFNMLSHTHSINQRGIGTKHVQSKPVDFLQPIIRYIDHELPIGMSNVMRLKDGYPQNKGRRQCVQNNVKALEEWKLLLGHANHPQDLLITKTQ